jgi:hypothetical protein
MESGAFLRIIVDKLRAHELLRDVPIVWCIEAVSTLYLEAVERVLTSKTNRPRQTKEHHLPFI